MFCSKCGAEVKKAGKFCAYCGNDLTAQAEKVKKQTKKAEEPAKEEVKEEVKVEAKPEVKEETKTVAVPAPKETTQSGGGKGTASLVIGIVNIVLPILVLPLSIVGLILGISEKQKDGKRTAGIVMNAIELGLSIIVTIIVIMFMAVAVTAENEYNTKKSSIWDTIEKETKKANVKIVGDSKYGYVEVPSTWITYKDGSTGSTIQYSDLNKKYILTLNVYDNDLTPYKAATNVEDFMKEKYNITPTRTYTKFGKNYGYKVSGYYSAGSKYIDTYLFEATDGKLHYIAIEGPSKYDDNFEIPNTFSMTK